jgi:hypothetical protein
MGADARGEASQFGRKHGADSAFVGMEGALKRALFPVLALIGFAALPAQADSGRYTLEKTANGYVRMDTQTGAMSMCEERGDQLVCKMAADERQAFQDELDRLATKVSDLESRIAKVENNPVMNPRSLLPTEEEFDRSLSFMERFFRRFMDIVRDMEDQTATATPRKT